MTNHTHTNRFDYSGKLLDEKTVKPDPQQQFGQWLLEAIHAGVNDASAMILATAGDQGFPGVRTVLLRNYDSNGFTFFTNYHSRKGKELDRNPQASLLFYWPQLFRQIRIDGTVSKVDPKISESYFRERPRGSQISAWISPQSNEVKSREELEAKYLDFDKAHVDKEIPYPSFWGGYCLQPLAYEFWQGQPNRLHDRIKYTLRFDSEALWHIGRLAP